jgi:DNA repair protein RadA/Sms
MKYKTAFFCRICGTEHSKWQGQCKSCKEWNSLVEEKIQKNQMSKRVYNNENRSNKSIQLFKIEINDETRIITSDKELNRVMGGGLTRGSLTLLGGEPGIGKSTLLLQVVLSSKYRSLYVSGEESLKQIKLRSSRIGLSNKNCFVLSETLLNNIFNEIKEINPEFIIIDSIQTLKSENIDSPAGTISQIRETTSELIDYAKKTNTPVILIGHITKDGQIAGPKVLEHMVDTVLNFEGDKDYIYRILRSQKNRFGTIDEIGIYEMGSKGIRPVSNPNKLLISLDNNNLSGQAISVTMKGIRPILLEIQSLVSSAVYGTPQRSCTGFNSKRLNMLLAVLEKKAGFTLASKDVFINFTGGISINDPALDLGVMVSILSSYFDKSIKKDMCFSAEIDLSGKLRPISKIDSRIKEAAKLGFKSIFISKNNKVDSVFKDIDVISVEKIEDVVSILFG